MLKEISEAINNLEKNKETKCLIVSSEGKTAFSAGADLTELQKLTTKMAKNLSIKGKKVFSKIENTSIPVLAKINGYALGGGLELALACDFRVASINSQFGLPEVKLGLVPGWGGTVRLPLIVGEKKSKQLIKSGDHINAKQALEMGLVDNVFLLEDFDKKVQALAQKLCDCPPLAGVLLKKKNFSNSLDDEFNKETEVFSHLFSLPETKNRLAEVIS
jgi:enoyl-CoA hydratase/carnithine racemase